MTDVYAGESILSAHNANHESRIDSLETSVFALANVWTDFASMTITGSVSNPTMGSSTKTARYKQIGTVVFFTGRFNCDTGGGFAAGNGDWRFQLPVTADLTQISHTGAVFLNDSGTALRLGVCQVQAATYLVCYYNNAAASATSLGNAGPGSAWNTGDHVEFSIAYEAG